MSGGRPSLDDLRRRMRDVVPDRSRAALAPRGGDARRSNGRRDGEFHVHDRGVRLPDGTRTCFWCYVSWRLGVRP